MIDIKFVREHAEEIKRNCQIRNVKVDIDLLLATHTKLKEVETELENFRSQINKASKTKPTPEIIEEMKALKEKIKSSETIQAELKSNFDILANQIPNLTHKETPVGGEDDFKVLEERGVKPDSSFKAKDHEEILLERNLVDFERGAKIAGSKFYFAKGDLVRLNQALIAYGIDVATNRGFELLETPDLAKKEILESAGFNPRGEETQIYSVEGQDLSLIGTAEISVLGYHAD